METDKNRASEKSSAVSEIWRAHIRPSIPLSVMQPIRMGRRFSRLSAAYWSKRESFTCPICLWTGKFLDFGPDYCRMFDEECPWCGAAGRHRLQYCVLQEFFENYESKDKSAIHFAPEPRISRYLRPKFAVYHTADLNPWSVDFEVDLRKLPFADQSYDFVYASHVLEHIDDDRRALSEIVRILRPNGVAILPVPVVCAKTVEYPYPVPAEACHVRSPGLDYFDRYAAVFRNVAVKTSDDFPEKFHLYICEDRTAFPRELVPFRPVMPGYRHLDYVPICRL